MTDQRDNIRVDVVERQSSGNDFASTKIEFVITQFAGQFTCKEIKLDTLGAVTLSEALKKAISKHSILPPCSPGENVRRWLKLQLSEALMQERYSDSDAIRYILKCVQNWERQCKNPIANIDTDQLVTEVVDEL